MKRIKKHISTIILVIIFLTGLGLIAYPTVSNYWNTIVASHTVADYSYTIANLNDAEYRQLLESARQYNARLALRPMSLVLTDEQREEYSDQLNFDDIMGYINIPSIRVTLPIYHGTSETVLQVGVGHLEGTSLPVGGVGTHCVLSGHRGLPSAKLFTDLDQLVVGDQFTLNVLDETLTYEVDQILIVDPDDTSALAIDPDQDYCTLVTCTPYGINTHRLLVRGHRTDNAETIRITADAVQIEPVVVAPFAAVPILIVMLALVFYRPRRHREEERDEFEE